MVHDRGGVYYHVYEEVYSMSRTIGRLGRVIAMILVDTSVLIDFLKGRQNQKTTLLKEEP